MRDKCLNNGIDDVHLVNMPADIKDWTEKDKKAHPCSTFVFAAYLPPGLHQFAIYCPLTDKLYCEEILVNLSYFDHFPEYPTASKQPKKILYQNVWRRYIPETPEAYEALF